MREETKRFLVAVGFTAHVEAIEKGLCPICRKPIKEQQFRDKKSVHEFEISGMCQNCQDQIFGR